MEKNKILKIVGIIFSIFMLSLNFDVNAGNFLYDISNNSNAVASSISTDSESPVFNFQSVAQILMEPTTGEILYANNENEKLLPASVTKVMTY